MAKKPTGSMKAKRLTMDVIVHIFLVVVAVIWLIPFVWLVAHSLRAESTGMFTYTFFPKEFTMNNYVQLLTETTSMNFPRMFLNTFFIT